jgi:hypothetical protein
MVKLDGNMSHLILSACNELWRSHPAICFRVQTMQLPLPWLSFMLFHAMSCDSVADSNFDNANYCVLAQLFLFRLCIFLLAFPKTYTSAQGILSYAMVLSDILN